MKKCLQLLKIKNLNNIYSKIPRDQPASFTDKASDDFNKNLELFSGIVGEDSANIMPEELWNGHKAGLEVFDVYHTSENIYQTAVLAEAAHVNAYNIYKDDDWTPLYAAGAISSYEAFLDFAIRDAGMGQIIGETEISFFCGKILYRDSNTSKEVAIEECLHYKLFSYCSFDYSLDHLNIEDKNYLINLYYSGAVLMEMSSYIEDEEFLKELCSEQLEHWGKLDEITDQQLMTYNLERFPGETRSQALNRIRLVKERLQDILASIEK